MAKKSASELEKILESKPKLRLVLMSEIELATKHGAPKSALDGVAYTIKNYDGKIDAVVINGGMPYLPDRYSRLRGERLDLIEGRLKERYGKEIYDFVKQGKNSSDSIEDLSEAARMGKVILNEINEACKEKGIKEIYVYGENDYRNVKTIIEWLEKIKAFNIKKSKHDEDDQKDLKDTEVEKLLERIPEKYKLSPSQWTNVDDEGIKDRANAIYGELLSSVFSDSSGKPNKNLITLKRFESDPNSPHSKRQTSEGDDVLINDVKIKIYHAINGLTAGRSEGKPTENSVNMTIKRVEKDAMHGRLADIYLTAHQVSTDFTAIDFQSKETPTYILNQGALWDIDKKDELRSKWIYASDMKAEDEDSGISIFTLYDDYSVDIQHIDFTGLNEKLDINAMEKEADKKLQEMSNLSDLHIGAADTKYNIIEAAIDRLSASKVPKDKRYLFLLGDILHAGNDKASRTKILFPTSNIQEETISKLEKELGNAKTKEELKQKIVSVFEDVLYGASTPDIGRQNRRANYYLRPLIDKFGTMITVPGNHGEKTMNGDESGMFGPNFENGGTKVEYIDDLLLKDEIPNIGGYNMFIIHSPGFRGGYDAGTTLMKTVENEGRDTTDMALAGDCHEPHLKFIAKKKTVQNGKQNAGKWKTLIAVTAPSLERYSRFESEVVKKPRFSRGISRIFLPDDQNIGTSYSRYNFIPEYTLKIYAEANGSKAENVINKYLEALEK